MAQTGFTPIQIYSSSTPTNAPSAGNLTNDTKGSELAINIADKNLFFKDSTNAVNTVPIRQSGAASDGWLSSTDWNTFNSKQAALVSGVNIKTVSGTTLLGSGDLGTIGTGYGGTGLTSFTTNGAVYATSTSALTTGTLPIASGGTGQTSFTTGYVHFGSFSTDAGFFWDNTNKRLGVGTTSPSTGIQITQANDTYSSGLGVRAASGTAVRLYLGVDHSTSTARVSTDNTNLLVEAGSARSVIFNTNSTERARIPSAGGLQVVNCVSVGNAVPSTSGAGITFPATASASSDANTLDDYEEGSWTPTISSSIGAITTSSSSSSNYVKVGNIVSFTVVLTVTNNGTGAGALIFTLPFSGSKGYASAIGVNTSSGATVSGSSDSANPSTMYMTTTAGLYPIASGQSLRVSGTYII